MEARVVARVVARAEARVVARVEARVVAIAMELGGKRDGAGGGWWRQIMWQGHVSVPA